MKLDKQIKKLEKESSIEEIILKINELIEKSNNITVDEISRELITKSKRGR